MTDPRELSEHAADLVCAVHDNDRDACHRILLERSTDELYALAVILAASVREDDPLMAQWQEERVVFADIRDVVCHALEVSLEDFDCEGRPKAAAAKARHIAAWIASQLGYSSTELARLMRRNHSTILAGVSQVTADRRLYRVAEAIVAEHFAGSKK
jgi:chromosomal replication initiation ATPase DnaA